jgi:hypothetical protein
MIKSHNLGEFIAANSTFAQALSGKESTHMLLADRVLPDLINAAYLSGNPIAHQAAATLAAWDRNADAASKGAVLFEAWWTIVSNDQTLAKDNTINFYSRHPKFCPPARPFLATWSRLWRVSCSGRSAE